MDQINQILKGFSFSEAESEVYIAALKLKKSSVSEIAQKAGMGRTAAYFHIQNLLKRNVLRQTKNKKKILISPVSPAELAERFEESVGHFKSWIPQLEVLSEIENEIPEIQMEESSIAFKKIYDEVIHMPAGSIFRVIEDRRGAEGELKLQTNDYWNHFFSQMAEKKIFTQAIFTVELLADVNKAITPENYAILKKRLWDIRTLPEAKLPIKSLVLLYNKKLSFLFPELSLTITVKHAALFALFDTLFETIFSFGQKVENPWEVPKKNF